MRAAGRDFRIDGRLIRIARLAAEGYDFLDAPEEALAALRQSKTRIDLLTFAQKLPQTSPLFSYPMEWDNVAALPVSTYDGWLANQINAKTRNMTRKAEKKGVVVREVSFDEALVQGISTIYNETPVRQGKAFWHYGKGLEEVRKENGSFPERSVFLGAFFEGSLIGFAKLVSDESHAQAGLMQILAMIQHRDKAPTNALIAQAVRSCAQRQIPYLVYAKFSYGSKQRDSLAEFKEHNGFQRIELPRYYVPLTPLGRIALRLGLHHKLADRLPEPVLGQIRKIRSLLVSKRASVYKGITQS